MGHDVGRGGPGRSRAPGLAHSRTVIAPMCYLTLESFLPVTRTDS